MLTKLTGKHILRTAGAEIFPSDTSYTNAIAPTISLSINCLTSVGASSEHTIKKVELPNSKSKINPKVLSNRL